MNVQATLTFGSYHDVDSNELSFRIAASKCFREATKKAKPILLEPIMKVEISTPEEYMGDILGDVNAKRGQINEMSDRGMAKIVAAFVPLSEMFGYATSLRSNTQGRGVFTMTFESYEETPKSIAEGIIKKNGGE